MTNLPLTFSSYAIDRRPIADISMSNVLTSDLVNLLTGLYESGFRRFVIPSFSAEALWNTSQECSDWWQAVSDFVDACSHPIVVTVRYDIESRIDYATGLLAQSFIDEEVVHVFDAGVSGFLSQASEFGSEPYHGCSHPHLRQLLSVFDYACIWRDSTQDPYISVSGSCDLPEWYQAPAEVVAGLSPYSGWASEPMRRNVEAVVVIAHESASSLVFSSCASWGFVPCVSIPVLSDTSAYADMVNAYLDAENKIKSTFARSKQLVVSASGARRFCGGVPASEAFHGSNAYALARIICPANIDCSHSDYETHGVPHLSSAACAAAPMFEDSLWAPDLGVAVSGKLAYPSMFSSTGAGKAAELALEMLADEFSLHPDLGVVGELSSVIVLSHWGRGGGSDASEDLTYESSRLTVHASDAVVQLVQSRPLIASRDTIYNASGMASCSVWMRDFIMRFDAYRQRLAVLAGCSIPAPWMIIVKSKLQVSLDSAVCNPELIDGVLKYGNWADQRADARWATEQVADFGYGSVTAQQFSTAGQEYVCTGYRPDGTVSRNFTTADLQTDISPVDPIGNRPFAKWYGDLSRASAANALSKSVGIMSRHHFPGCATACPDLVPGNHGAIVAQEPGRPVFCQVQQKPFSAAGIAATPSIFMAHTGMIAQGHSSLPSVPSGARMLAKCSADGSQRPDWYVSSPIGDCSWQYGDTTVPFSFVESSSSSSSAAYEPSYQKTSVAASMSAPMPTTSVEINARPMSSIYLESSSVSSEAP